MTPETDREFTFEHVGRLIAWTDDLRKELAYLSDPITEIAILAHEDITALAEGYSSNGTLEEEKWTKTIHHFHGLDRSFGDA
jgi:hypothetical protein